MISRALISFFMLALAACETVPSSMDPDAFGTEMSGLASNPSIASVDEQLSLLLARTDLATEQRADALYMRAERRLDARFDLPGAIEDFEAFLQVQLEDPRVSTADRRKIFAAAEIETAQRRLARLQNLPDWFDDKVLMGDFAVAAARYRTAGITPTEAQLYLLKEGGFVCVGNSNQNLEAVHKYGTLREDAANAVWCEGPSVS